MKSLFRSCLLLFSSLLVHTCCSSQMEWKNVDSFYQPLPPSVHIYRSDTPLDGKPNIAYYLEADLNDRQLLFETDTSHQRRLTISQFYTKNDSPLVVVNTTFFSFATNQNLNVVIRNGKLVSGNVHTFIGRGKDTFTYRHVYPGTLGIDKRRKPDIAWTFVDSSRKLVYASQQPLSVTRDSVDRVPQRTTLRKKGFRKWKMVTGFGGGPVLIQDGKTRISNNEEWRFPGKALDDLHPRTAVGYTASGKIILLVVQGRFPTKANGASLVHLAAILQELGCTEALNLDGGGSSFMLVNGKPTIQGSDNTGQRPIPAVFIIRKTN